MMILGGALDTLKFKIEMESVFRSHNSRSASKGMISENYHQGYLINEDKLKRYIVKLQTMSIVDSIKRLLYPFLPERLKANDKFPYLYYLNYGTPEATGNGGIVINDLLFSYKIDQYKLGLLSAHEAFHAIVSIAFQKALVDPGNQNAEMNFINFLENISEEGIADLIDKPLLQRKGSPVYAEVSQLLKDDELISVKYIKKLDSLLLICSASNDALKAYPSYYSIAEHLGQNGGHIPGRFMAKKIAQAALLSKQILKIEDPISFILSYNEAVSVLGKNSYPKLSKESIEYLKSLEAKYFVK